MRRVAVTIGLVVMAGCGPDFDALFRAGAAPDAAAPTPPLPEHDASQGTPTDAGDGSKSDAASDAGCAVHSCSPAPICDGTGVCTYSCEECGCVCQSPQQCPPVLGNSCSTTCAKDTVCDVSCNAGTQGLSPGTCTFVARGAQRAAYSCGANAGSCTATCDEGAACSLSCNQFSTACHLACNDTASCLLGCNYSTDCKLDCASGAAQNCLDGSKTCNRACP